MRNERKILLGLNLNEAGQMNRNLQKALLQMVDIEKGKISKSPGKLRRKETMDKLNAVLQ